MKEKKPETAQKPTQPRDPARERTNPPGQNPRQDDAPDHDVHHDESRVNPLSDQRSG